MMYVLAYIFYKFTIIAAMIFRFFFFVVSLLCLWLLYRIERKSGRTGRTQQRNAKISSPYRHYQYLCCNDCC